MTKKVGLIILDGWGIGKNDHSNAILSAQTPFTHHLNNTAAHATLRTDGEFVGLPEGQMGNSEVGHMNIGAGRVVYQDLVKIHLSIRNNELHKNEVLLAALQHAKKENKNVHFIGLVSDGGVHSHISHLKALIDICEEQELSKVFIHAITDGRDCDPKSGEGFIQDLENHLEGKQAKIASVIGRYFAMDRDKRWERVKKAYELFVNGSHEKSPSAALAVAQSYVNGVTDEFIEPIQIEGNYQGIEEGDVAICFNFRTDRCREITMALHQQDFPDFGMKKIPLYYVTMTRYDDSFQNVHILFEKDNLLHTLGETLSAANKTQLRIAETEKYPHVTFFFNGGREEPFSGESRLMVPSPKVATYDLQPEMSAKEIASSCIQFLHDKTPDFFCLNFANPDMVGHTGVYEAIVKAIETTDACLKEVAETAVELGYSLIVIADHGNADCAVNEDGSPNTAHTINPVPVWIVDNDITEINNGKLADVAPTVLTLLGIEKPQTMSGVSLI
jgi:2,3-bisphosphoglycerate-independent phosphoglycerate mutase